MTHYTAHPDTLMLYILHTYTLLYPIPTQDLKNLPRNSAVRKINELVKRVRGGKVHAYIISNLKEQMPMMMGHAKKQKQVSYTTVYTILLSILHYTVTIYS